MLNLAVFADTQTDEIRDLISLSAFCCALLELSHV